MSHRDLCNLHKGRLIGACLAGGLTWLLSSLDVHASPMKATSARHTPYDLYMGPVFEVFSRMGSDSPALERVRELMQQALSFEYKMEDPLRPLHPAETSKRRAGDCKAKALWLCQQMNDATVLYVIGRVSPDSPINHAWLQWRKGEQWYVLDATNTAEPLPIEQLGYDRYTPLYAFGKAGALRFQPAQMASSPRTASSSGRPLAVSGH